MDVDDPFYENDYLLADCYFYGNGTKQNFDKAREYYQIGIEDNSGDSQDLPAQIKLDALDHDDPVKAFNEYIDNYDLELDDDHPLKELSDLLDEEKMARKYVSSNFLKFDI